MIVSIENFQGRKELVIQHSGITTKVGYGKRFASQRGTFLEWFESNLRHRCNQRHGIYVYTVGKAK